jgi:dihydroorotate dehydrogenase (fumarate)
MNLTTSYLGLDLMNPFIAGAGPLSDSVDNCRRLEDCQAAAIVLRSLFEEQIAMEGIATHRNLDFATATSEAVTYLPQPDDFVLGPEEYLEHLAKVKRVVDIPVIGSLNGSTPGGWLEYAKLIQQAGADAIELHVYQVPTDPDLKGRSIERDTVEMVRTVKNSVRIPVAVKLSPFYTNFANVARDLDTIGADGLVLFNRIYQPDIDVEHLEVISKLKLSDSSELPLRLRWLAILCDRVSASLAVTGGVHQAIDAVRAIMCGAHAVQMVSALLLRGPSHLQTIQQDLLDWLDANEYQSLSQMRGSMGLQRCPDPKSYLRGNYMQVLQVWNG